MVNSHDRFWITVVSTIVLPLFLVGCGQSAQQTESNNDQSSQSEAPQQSVSDTTPINPDVEEISRHPTDMPEHADYQLFKDGEYQQPAEDGEPITKEVHFDIEEVEAEIVPGTSRELWTFNGKVPGPMIRGEVGDRIQFNLHNPESNQFPHNVDFHAVTGPGGGSVSLDVLPGETSKMEVKLIKPGIYVYHCAFPPIPNHIEHGMYGLVVVEPEGGLENVDEEYYVFQSEYYTELGGDQTAAATENSGRISPSSEYGVLEEPTYVSFNGRPGAITGERALGKFNSTLKTGDTARFYVGNIGPNLISSFHIIGEMFDKVFVEGSFDLVNNDVQTTLVPSGGAVGVEVTFDVPGEYIPVDHSIHRTHKGALGKIHVEGEANPEVYKPIEKSDIR